MTVEPHEMTGFRWDILWTLLAGDDYGLGLKSALSDYRGEEVNHGRLYPNLDWLIRQGLVEKWEQDDRTNGYGLTDKGKTLLEDRFSFIDDRASERHLIHVDADDTIVFQERDEATGGGR